MGKEPKLTRFSFNGGILDDRLRWRSDLQWYSNSCKELQNAIVEPFGSVRKRRGFGTLEDVTPVDTTEEMKIIPFDIQSDQDAYYLVLNGSKRVTVDFSHWPCSVAHAVQVAS